MVVCKGLGFAGVVSQDRGPQLKPQNTLDSSPYSRDPQNGTPNFGKLPDRIGFLSKWGVPPYVWTYGLLEAYGIMVYPACLHLFGGMWFVDLAV